VFVIIVFCPCSWPYFRIYSSWYRRLFNQNTQLYTILTFIFQMVGLWQLILMFTWPFLCTFLSLAHVTLQYLSMISGGYHRCLLHHVFQWSDSQMLSKAARNSWFVFINPRVRKSFCYSISSDSSLTWMYQIYFLIYKFISLYDPADRKQIILLKNQIQLLVQD